MEDIKAKLTRIINRLSDKYQFNLEELFQFEDDESLGNLDIAVLLEALQELGYRIGGSAAGWRYCAMGSIGVSYVGGPLIREKKPDPNIIALAEFLRKENHTAKVLEAETQKLFIRLLCQPLTSLTGGIDFEYNIEPELAALINLARQGADKFYQGYGPNVFEGRPWLFIGPPATGKSVLSHYLLSWEFTDADHRVLEMVESDSLPEILSKSEGFSFETSWGNGSWEKISTIIASKKAVIFTSQEYPPEDKKQLFRILNFADAAFN